ncbi:hypothetical protein NDU88_006346 [Pleurodeles waltl]|uniref:Uncharacterized protein n=1 Tax=Pleurodeles waltl TaxID=8319 RepID=A0AAV7MDM8_PLEWA|nr:hypothetical protein NDU88_006346 [Pleurodeles waltl]
MVGPECNRQGGLTDTFSYVYFSAGQRPSEKGCMACHCQGRADPGGLWQAEHPLSQTVGGPGRWARKTVVAQLWMACQRGRGACRTLTPLMAHILAGACLELDGRLGASQQPQGASSGGGAEAPAMEGAASHRTQDAESTDIEGTSRMEGEGSTTVETGGDSSDSDTSSDGSSLVVAGTTVASL